MRNNIKRFAVAVLAACGLAVSAALAAPSYQAKLTAQGYTGAELANFPVLVRLSPQTVDGFAYDQCQENGSDITFVDEIGEPINCQLDTWNPDGESLFWVCLPALRPGVSFHVRWGDSQSNVDPKRSAATWNANYGAVWHMGEASGVCANSTSHGSAYDATPKGETTESVRYDGSDAPVGGARTTSKSKTAYLEVPDYDALQCGDTFTFSGWMRLTGSISYGIPLARKTSPDQRSGWEMTMVAWNLDRLRIFGASATGPTVTFPGDGFKKNWVHFALVYSGSTVSVYGNGALLGSGAVTAVNDNGLPLCIGNTGNATKPVSGAFDELRLMKGAASADWVKAEHATVAKADFLTYGARGSAEIASPLGISAVKIEARGENFVDLRATLTGLGENAAKASIQLAYGFDETSLVKTQDVCEATAPSHLPLRLDRLLPQRVYCVQVVAVNDQGERAVSDPVLVMTAVSQDAYGASGVAGLNQTFFTQADKDWSKSYAEIPPGTNWLNYQDDNRIYRRELGVLAAYLGGNPGPAAKKRPSNVWDDEVYWPENGGQWVYWGLMHLEGGKSYCFRTRIDDNERVQVTDPRTGLTTTLIEDVLNDGNGKTSLPFVPKATGWYPIEIRLSDRGNGAGGCQSASGYQNTENMGWSDDGGRTWKLMMDPGDGSLLSAVDHQAIRVDEVIADDALQSLMLTFSPAGKARDLYAAWGGQHGGVTTNGWTHVQKLATVAPGCETYVHTLPADWGENDNRVIRFFFFVDGTLQSCSSSVYWRDVADPEVSLDALDGWGGDTLTVTGSVSFAGSPCTLKVLVGQTPEALDQVWTELPGSDIQAPGAFSLTLSEDKTSSKYLAPGETYYVCVEATAGGSVSRSQVMQVTMAGADAFESAVAKVSRLTVTFSGVLAGRGMGESAKVSLWVGETEDEEMFKMLRGPRDVQGGEFSFTNKFEHFERTYYWQFRAVSTSAGETAVVTTRTAVASCTTADTATYTWKGGADDDWENPANWGNNGGDVLGYPNGTQTTVQFPAGTKARIVLCAATSVGTLKLEQPGIDVTFARADGLGAEDAKPKLSVKNAPTLTGARLRLALDGVALDTGGTTILNAFDGEVRLSNGASWYLYGRLENRQGGRLWLGPGTSLSCSDYWFGGGLTVIDDATLEVRGSALLGTVTNGGTIRFVGKQPAFRCSAQGANVRSDLEAANVRLEFALPVGGYATPPIFNAFANPSYIMGSNNNTKRLYPITVDVAPDSPGVFDLQTTNTTLISWGKGICSNIIQTAAQPGANATFVWSEKNVSGNPVSLGVRLVFSYTNELHVTGSPEEVPCEGLAPGYGVTNVPLGESITCTAPAEMLQLSEKKRATCVGWKLYSVDAATRTRKLVRKGAGTSCTYTNENGLWHELVWQWKVEYRVTVMTDGNGTASVEPEWVETGKRVCVTITPDNGYAFGKWTAGAPADHDKDPSLTFTVLDQAYDFTASFLPVVYVSPSGDDDTNDGKSPATAFQTIKKALESESPVCALLADGTYEVTEQIVIDNGSIVAGLNPGAKAVVKLMKKLPSAGAEGSVFKLAADAQLRNVTVTTDFDRGDSNKNAYDVPRNGDFGRGVWIEQAGLVDGCVITNCRTLECNSNGGGGGGGVYLNKGGIVRRTLLTHNCTYSRDPRNPAMGHNALLNGGGLVESCRLVWGGAGETTETRCGGVYSNGGTVRNSLVACNTQTRDGAATGFAVHLIGGVMENCTVVSNFHSKSSQAPAVYAQSVNKDVKKDPVIRNCMIWGNTGDGAGANWGLEPGRCVVANTCAWPLMPGDGNIAADPKLRGYGKFAFRPTSESPCIDAGVWLPWMDETAVDVYGRPRQQGKGPDIGAAEFSPAGLMIQVR